MFVIRSYHGSRATRAVKGGINIHISEDASIAALGSKKADILRVAMREVVKYWNERLEVKNPVKKIVLDRQCAGPGVWSGVGCPAQYGCKKVTKCGEVEVPADHLAQCQLCGQDGCTKSGEQGRGVRGVDMILYMSAKVSNLCRETATLSHASHCQQVYSIFILMNRSHCYTI